MLPKRIVDGPSRVSRKRDAGEVLTDIVRTYNVSLATISRLQA